jgi:uncharacterized membrane protein YfcA
MMMLDFIFYIFAGATVGLAIGLTGIGGGSLMTPLLILFGFPYNVAIGTDLLYAAITKAGGMVSHSRQKTVEWHLVGYMSLGSLPASMATAFLLDRVFMDASQYESILTFSLGLMLVLTATLILMRGKLAIATLTSPPISKKTADIKLFFVGIFLGVFVTLSSVGAGAFGAAVLMMLYPYLKTVKIVGTDIAHAVPLTLIAGLGHLFILGNVDFLLLLGLLIGSLPAITVAAKIANQIPGKVLQKVIALLLMAIGINFVIF